MPRAAGLPAPIGLRWACLATVFVAVSCGPTELSDADDTAGVDRTAAQRLVRRLGSGSAAERDAAARGLVDLGPPVLPLVTAARRHATGEQDHRLADVERLLLHRVMNAAIEPAMVTLAADDAPAGDVLRRLFSQTGSRIEIAAAADRRLSWRCDRATFWEAVDELLGRSALALDFHVPAGERSEARLRIVDAPGEETAAPSVASGPIRVSIAGIERTGRAAGAAGDAAGRGARITLRVAWEPRLEPLVVRLPARSLVAEGPGGESLPVAQRAAVVEAMVAPRRPWVDMPVLFAPPAVPLERLGMLRGTVLLWLRGMEHAFRFEGVPADDESAARKAAGPLRVGQAEVRLLDVRSADGRLQARASVTYDADSEALASHHAWLAARMLEARLGDDTPLEQVGQRVEARSDRGITVAAEFIIPQPTGSASARGRDVVIQWTLPIAIHELPVDFALRDVPLPAPEPR